MKARLTMLDGDRVELLHHGVTVTVELKVTADGPAIALGCSTSLEGIAPGFYVLGAPEGDAA